MPSVCVLASVFLRLAEAPPIATAPSTACRRESSLSAGVEQCSTAAERRVLAPVESTRDDDAVGGAGDVAGDGGDRRYPLSTTRRPLDDHRWSQPRHPRSRSRCQPGSYTQPDSVVAASIRLTISNIVRDIDMVLFTRTRCLRCRRRSVTSMAQPRRTVGKSMASGHVNGEHRRRRATDLLRSSGVHARYSRESRRSRH